MAATSGAVAAPSGRTGSYIVVLKGNASPSTLARAHASRYGAKVGHVYRHALRGYSATLPSDRVAALKADPNVAAVTPDLPVHAFAQTLPTGVNRIDGELSSAVSGNGSGAVDADIAIIDTGIATNHPDLNVVGGVNCLGGSSSNDDNGHGTHVAGIGAARDDTNGVVGVAPGARLWAVKVLNSAGSGSTSQIVCGIDLGHRPG
jgi:subtilisin